MVQQTLKFSIKDAFYICRASKAGEVEKRKGSVFENVVEKKSIYSERPAEKKFKFSDASEKITNLGEVKNGIVSFDEKTATAKSQSQAYHSSSEEDEEAGGGGDNSQQASVKKKSTVDKKSTEHKEKLKQRFLEKQKLSSKETAVKPQKVTKPKGKYYEGSSDEEEEEEETNIQTEEKNVKESGDVFKNLKTFSNVWQDSDDEEEDEESESDSSEDSSSEEDEEESNTKRANLHKQLQESAGNTDTNPNSKLVITRYDPTLDDQDQFLRTEDGGVSNKAEEESSTEKVNKESKTFEIRTDLKQAFGGGSTSSGFSFGFLGGAPQESDALNEKAEQFLPSAEYESDTEEIKSVTKPKMDIGARFGMQLKGKGVTKSSRSFFFTPEDARLEDGVKFFFEHEVDVDNIREKFNEKRPILSEILKKRLRNKQKRMQPARGSSKKKGAWQGQKGIANRHSHKSKNK